VRNVFGLASHVVAELVPGSFAASALSSHSPVRQFLQALSKTQRWVVLSGRAGSHFVRLRAPRAAGNLVPCAASGKRIGARNDAPSA
jgi:hypothetical protein